MENRNSMALAGLAPRKGANAKEVVIHRVVVPDARDRWMSATARSYTPEQVENILRSAFSGDLRSQWELFDLMEDTWPRLAKALNELKDAVVSQDWTVQAWSSMDEEPTETALERARLLEEAVWGMRPEPDADENGFTQTIKDLLDAWGKGVSVLEVHWEMKRAAAGRLWTPRCTTWVTPRNYGWPTDGGRLMLDLQELPEDSRKFLQEDVEGFARFPREKFLIGICKQKTGHPLAGALLRPLAWWWCAANFAQHWWLNFAQIFGLPIRWATYDPNRPNILKDVCDMLENMGSQAWAAFPEGTQLELKEASNTGTQNPQISLLDRADKQVDLLILGQTLTSDVGDSGSRALGDVHQSVRQDRREAASSWVAEVLQQLAHAFCQLNWGNTDDCPWFQPSDETPEDAKEMAERDMILSGLGMGMPKTWLHERHGIPMGGEGEEVIGGRPAPVLDAEDLRDAPDAPAVTARGAIQARAASNQLADHVMESLTGVESRWLAGVRPYFARLIALAQSDRVSDDDFIQALERAALEMPELFDRMDTKALQDAMEAAMGAAVVNGALDASRTRRLPQ